MNKEFLEKAKACKTAEEVKKLAEKESIELTDEQLKEVAGGREMAIYTTVKQCPYCKNNINKIDYQRHLSVCFKRP